MMMPSPLPSKDPAKMQKPKPLKPSVKGPIGRGPSGKPVKNGGPMDEMMRGSRPDSGSSSGSSGGSGGLLNRVVDTATSVIKPQVQKQANKKFGPLGGMVAGGEVDKIGSDVKSGNYGGALDRAVKGAGKLFNSVDMFDIIKGHLLDEGYADTEQAALAIMANMSEEWRQDIIEQSLGGYQAPTTLFARREPGEATAFSSGTKSKQRPFDPVAFKAGGGEAKLRQNPNMNRIDVQRQGNINIRNSKPQP